MIFREDLARKICRGRKTQTRRAQSTNPRSPWSSVCCAYKLDQVFTINPGRGVTGVATARITADPYRDVVSRITDEDARAEGFVDRDRFLEAFCEINGAAAVAMPVWVVKFELVEILDPEYEPAVLPVGGVA